MTSREFLKKERQLALRYGVRKTDVLFQMVRCTECEHEALLRTRFTQSAFETIEAIERLMLRSLRREVDVVCKECGHQPLTGDGGRHVFLVYSERERAHLAVTLRLTHEDDGRTRVLRQAWFVPLDGRAEELEAADERLELFWIDGRIRQAALMPETDDAARALTEIARERDVDPLALRELGLVLLEAGRTDSAIEALTLSLAADDTQADVARRLGAVLVAQGRPSEGAEHLVRAFELTEDPDLLPELVRAAYRGRQLGALATAASAILDEDPESLVALRGIVCCGSVAEVGSWNDEWQSLHDAADRAGDRNTRAVAAWWLAATALPLPDWSAGLEARTYARLCAAELRAHGWTVRTNAPPLSAGAAALPIDLQAEDGEGNVWLFVCHEHVATAAGDHRLRAGIRAARETLGRDARFVPLSPQPLHWPMLRWASDAPSAALDLEADADTTMHVVDENVAAWMHAADAHFGRPLDFSLDSLQEVDAILALFHDDGFGAITFALQCQAASYVAAVVSQFAEGAMWADADAPMDPRVFQLREGERINLVSKVGRTVRNGADDGIYSFVGAVLHHHLGGT